DRSFFFFFDVVVVVVLLVFFAIGLPGDVGEAAFFLFVRDVPFFAVVVVVVVVAFLGATATVDFSSLIEAILTGSVAPLPFVWTRVRPTTAAFRYFLMNGDSLSASTL